MKNPHKRVAVREGDQGNRSRYPALQSALHELEAAGPNGFEGFILSQVSRLTGRRFLLAKAGAQAGKDASTSGYGETYVDIECKRYEQGKSPSERELVGGFDQAVDASDGRLDLWLLVSTGRIGSTEAEALRRKSQRDAVSVEIIDWQEAGLPQLALLCAELFTDTIQEFQSRGISADLKLVATELEALRNDRGFSAHVSDLRQRLSAADLGLDHARSVANEWIRTRLATKLDAMDAFNQALCVADANFQPYVRRAAAEEALSTWYARWREHPSIAAVLGREGNGKSWATMAWWNALDSKPLTLLVTSNREIETDALALVASALFTQTGIRDLWFWKRCVERWITRPQTAAPAILIIFDGLNERPRHAWKEVFGSIAATRWQGRLAVVATCRPVFWSERVVPVLPDDLAVTPVEVQPFNDPELTEAWCDRQPALSEMPIGVREFLRTPRVLRLARNHAARLSQSGDLTVERLLIEDWSDRLRVKSGLIHSSLEFNNLVIEIAREMRNGLGEFGHNSLREYSSLARRSPDRNLDRDFDEIMDGWLFERINSVSDRYRVRPEYAGLALGMLLAREIREAYQKSGTTGIDAVLAERIEPSADFDQVGAVLRGASTLACLEPEYPPEARRALLRAWLYARNLDAEQWHDFAAYLPRHPQTYFDLAEDLWFADEIYPTVRASVADAILYWRTSPVVGELLLNRCTRWLGLWHTDWHPFITKADSERITRRRQAVSKNWARLTEPERDLAGRFLRQATPNAPSIARLALLLISHGPRAPYVEGFVAWALSRAVMGLPDETEQVAWCLRLNDDDPAETETALLIAVERLLSNASEIGVGAARLLLRACGTPSASERLTLLPEVHREPWPHAWFADVDALDPAAPTPPQIDRALDNLTHFDPDALWRDLGQTTEQIQLNQLEPILAHFAPQALSRFYQKVLRNTGTREGVSLRQLAFQLPELVLLIGPDENNALDQGRRSLFHLLESNTCDARAVEAYLLAGVLPHHSAETQLRLLLERPSAALDLLMFEDIFAALPDALANEQIVGASAEGNPHVLWRLFWFLSRTKFALSNAARSVLVEAFSHSDAIVRGHAFLLAETCQDRAALKSHLVSEWCPPLRDETVESFYGSRALIAAASPVVYLNLRSRIVPALLGYLAAQDATLQGIDAFCKDLDSLWQVMTQTPISSPEPSLCVIRDTPRTGDKPDLERVVIDPLTEAALQSVRVFGREPTADELEKFFRQSDVDSMNRDQHDFQKRTKELIEQAQRAGHVFFGSHVLEYGLPGIFANHIEVVKKWIAFLDQCERVPWDTGEFYRALCGAIGSIDADGAAEILTELLRTTSIVTVSYSPFGIDSMTWLAFGLPSTAKVDAIRQGLLEDALTDELLLQIALAAQARGAMEWLARVLKRDLAASNTTTVARALTLIGFLDEGELLDQLSFHLDQQTGFLNDVAQTARQRSQQNHRARVWFQKFVAQRDPVEAWASFRLFLRCVDRRFYLWGTGMLTASADLPPLWKQHLRLNDQNIGRAVDENSGKLSEILFGFKISKGEIAPWYNTPRVACEQRSAKQHRTH